MFSNHENTSQGSNVFLNESCYSKGLKITNVKHLYVFPWAMNVAVVLKFLEV